MRIRILAFIAIIAVLSQPAAGFYSTKQGRFLQRDPLGVVPDDQDCNPFSVLVQYIDGANLYQYARSTPLCGGDANGLLFGRKYKCTPGTVRIKKWDVNLSIEGFTAEQLKMLKLLRKRIASIRGHGRQVKVIEDAFAAYAGVLGGVKVYWSAKFDCCVWDEVWLGSCPRTVWGRNMKIKQQHMDTKTNKAQWSFDELLVYGGANDPVDGLARLLVDARNRFQEMAEKLCKNQSRESARKYIDEH